VLNAKDLTPMTGSEVEIDAQQLLSGTYADELRELLIERGVLCFRNVPFDDAELRAFAESMGTLRMGTVYEQENDGMLKIVDISGSYFWHIDGTYTDFPPFATVLVPRVIAPVGGGTEFANTYAAYEDLPAEEQEFLQTLQVVHTMKAAHDRAVIDPTVEQFERWMGYSFTQPLIWNHENGRKSIVAGATASHIVGMHPADGREIIDRLTLHASQDKYVYKHAWRMGDVVMWDNTGTMHRVRPFDLSSGRLMHRFTLEGIEPFAGAGQQLATA